MKLYISLILVLSHGIASYGDIYPFRNTTLSWDERVKDLVSRLSLQEMVGMMNQGGVPGQPVIARLGLGSYQFDSECLHGEVYTNNVAFPAPVGLGAMFSPSLQFKVAEVISREIRAIYNYDSLHGDFNLGAGSSCLAPLTNIMRHPLWGRVHETYGEDPYLIGVMSQQFVWGLQGNDSRYVRVSAGCKTVAAYSGPEHIPVSRFGFNAIVSERDLRLTYLAPIKMCVDAGTYNLMCSYSSVNGIPSCAHKRILTDIVKKEYGFSGYYISDAGAIEGIYTFHKYTKTPLEAAVAAAKAGVNLELGTGGYYKQLFNAVEQKLMSFDEIVELVKPLLYTRLRIGDLDPRSGNPYSSISKTEIQSPEHREIAIEAAAASYVLLKNDDDILPFTKKFNKIAVVGPFGKDVNMMWSTYGPTLTKQFSKSPAEGLTPFAKDMAVATGCNDNLCLTYNGAEVINAVNGSDLVVVCLGLGEKLEEEDTDRVNLDFPGKQLWVLQDAVYNAPIDVPVVLLLFSGGPVDISWPKVSPFVPVIMQCFYPNQPAGDALARIMFAVDGNVTSPAGRLPYTWPKDMGQVPSMTNYSMEGRTYRYMTEDPLYPFGYGLSYSKFSYSGLKIAPSIVKPKQNVTVQATVQNIGNHDSDEVIQVYISWRDATVTMPQRQLVGFDRVFIPTGKSAAVSFTISSEQLQVWDDKKSFIWEDGTIDVYVGGQQPFQKTDVGSNVLHGSFKLTTTTESEEDHILWFNKKLKNFFNNLKKHDTL